MASRRFRSQPALQRTGGSPRSALLGLLLLAAIGLGAGALIGRFIHSPPPPAERMYAAGPTDQPAVTDVAPSPPAEATPAAAPAPQPAIEPQEAVPQPKAKPALSSRPRRGPTVERAAAPPPAREATWAEQQQAYEKARAAYDADERAAGYRWAEQNKIRLQRYCRVAAQRTPAFLEGCLNYLKARGAGVSHSPEDG